MKRTDNNLINISLILMLCLTLTSCKKEAKLEVIESEISITETTIETTVEATEETTIETEETSEITVTEVSETEIEETEETTVETTEITEVSVTSEIPLATPIPTPVPTATNVPTSTPVPTEVVESTQAPLPTATPAPTATPVPTATPIPTPTSTPIPTPTPLPARLYAMADVTYTVDCWTQERGDWQEVVTYNVEVVQNNGVNYIGLWVVCDDDTVANNLNRDFPYCYHYSNGYNITLTTEPYTK